MSVEDPIALVNSLYETWYSTLVRYAFRLTRNTARAEDAVQDSFMLLYRELAANKVVHHPRAWTLCVVRREVARQIRSYAAREIAMDGAAWTSTARSPRTDEPDFAFEFDAVERALGYLTPREQEVFLLRMECLKCREIADELGISINSVTTLLARALRKLMEVRPEPAHLVSAAKKIEPEGGKRVATALHGPTADLLP